MDYSKIYLLLERAGKALKVIEMENGGDIERDILLASLRDAYAEARFGAEQSADSAPEIPAHTPEPEPVVEPASEPVAEPVVEPVQVCVQEIVPEPELETIPEFVSQNLFENEPAYVKPAIDQDIIRSLYDAPAIEQPASRPQAAAEPAATQHLSSVPAPEMPAMPKVIGDVMNHDSLTLGDVVSVQTKPDVASQLNQRPITELRKSIGINDKFLLIRDLFGGSAVEYEKGMEALESFTDLDEALVFIHENYRWNPKQEAAVMLIDLLTRKLS